MVMLSLAASLLFSSGTGKSEQEAHAVYKAVQSSVVRLHSAGGNSIAGVLIDSRGLVLCHQALSSRGTITITSPLGRKYEAEQLSNDPVTGLVLLKAKGWSEPTASPIELGGEIGKDEALFAVLPNRAIKVTYAGSVFGVVEQGRRYLPLSEIRFEADGAYGGAPIVSTSGKLVGVLGATLTTTEKRAAPKSNKVGGIEVVMSRQASVAQSLGPLQQAIAYAAAPNILRRVVQAFTSDDPVMHYPAIGVLCQDSPTGGAEIVGVRPGSPAERAKFRAGDVILSVNGRTVNNQLEYARILLDLPIGVPANFVLRRVSGMESVIVTIGAD